MADSTIIVTKWCEQINCFIITGCLHLIPILSAVEKLPLNIDGHFSFIITISAPHKPNDHHQLVHVYFKQLYCTFEVVDQNIN